MHFRLRGNPVDSGPEPTAGHQLTFKVNVNIDVWQIQTKTSAFGRISITWTGAAGERILEFGQCAPKFVAEQNIRVRKI